MTRLAPLPFPKIPDPVGGSRVPRLLAGPRELMLLGCVLCPGLTGPADGTAQPLQFRAVSELPAAEMTEPTGPGPEDVLGTIHATLDGQPRTWYAVEGHARTGPYSSAVWREGANDRTIVSISTFDTDSPPVETFNVDVRQGRFSLGHYEGSSIVVTVPLPANTGPVTFAFPSEGSSAVSVSYLPNAASVVTGIDMTAFFSLAEGTITVVQGHRSDGLVQIRGTFSGILQSLEGPNRIRVTDGRFDVGGVPAAKALSASGPVNFAGPGRWPDERSDLGQDDGVEWEGILAQAAQAEEAPSPAGEGAGGAGMVATSREAPQEHPLGAPRDDLERFYGVYGEPEGLRNFFVAEASNATGDEPIPAGHLMVGAMWGDVQPWYMKSLSDTRFEQVWVSQFQDAPLVVAFETDADGNAVALTFEGLFEDRGRVERVGDLPEGW